LAKKKKGEMGKRNVPRQPPKIKGKDCEENTPSFPTIELNDSGYGPKKKKKKTPKKQRHQPKKKPQKPPTPNKKKKLNKESRKEKKRRRKKNQEWKRRNILRCVPVRPS